MTNRDFFIERWEAEVPATLRVFRAVPPNKLDYRPHPVSRAAGELLALLVYEVETGVGLAKNPDMDWAEPKTSHALEEMARAFERHSKDMIEGVRKLDDAYWNKTSRLLVGGQSVHENTVGGMYWELLFDAIHHRGQLSVYLRPMGAKVPSIYGPSADDMGG